MRVLADSCMTLREAAALWGVQIGTARGYVPRLCQVGSIGNVAVFRTLEIEAVHRERIARASSRRKLIPISVKDR